MQHFRQAAACSVHVEGLQLTHYVACCHDVKGGTQGRNIFSPTVLQHLDGAACGVSSQARRARTLMRLAHAALVCAA